MRRILLCAVAIGTAALFLPENAFAQAAISGVVKDSSGAALPGVTVEATSPALIEKARATVTDVRSISHSNTSTGHLHVTFTIDGFKTIGARASFSKATSTPRQCRSRSGRWKKPSPSPASHQSSMSSTTVKHSWSIARCSTRFRRRHAVCRRART